MRKRGKGRPGRCDAPVTQQLVNGFGHTLHLSLMAFDIGEGHFDAFRDLYQTLWIVSDAAESERLNNPDVAEVRGALEMLEGVWEACRETGHWQLSADQRKVVAGACIASQDAMKKLGVLSLATSYNKFCNR